MKGFTLIELLMALAIVAIMAAIFLNGGAAMSGQSTVSFGINGITEARCIDGYKFVIGEGGQARQVLDEFGKGVRCH